MEAITLATSVFEPKGECIASLVVVHGMMDHRRRYTYFAQSMAMRGYYVILYDQRGHGETARDNDELGFIAEEHGWQLLIKDCLSQIKAAKHVYPNVPCLLFGHSMGSLVTRSLLKQHDGQIDGVMLSGVVNVSNVGKIGKAVCRVLSKIKGKRGRSALLYKMVLGGFNKSVSHPRTTCDWLSKNEDNVDAYLNDPYCQFNFTTQAYFDLMYGMVDVNSSKAWLVQNENLPILFINGECDPCTGYQKGIDHSIMKLRQRGYTQIESIVYPSLRHEILNEKERDKVICDVVGWAQKNVL